MLLQDLGSIGEFLGSLLVFVTVVYIAVQTSQATRSQLSIEQQAIHSGHRELFIAVMSASDLAEIMDKASTNGKLTGAEVIRLTSLCKAHLNLILMQFQLRKVGTGREIDTQEEAAELRQLFQSYGGFLAVRWHVLKKTYATEFVDFVDLVVGGNSV